MSKKQTFTHPMEFVGTREERRYGVHHPAKVGDGPRKCVWVRIPKGGWAVGGWTVFRPDLDGKWTEAQVRKIGPPPEYLLSLEI
jgi:hypothetical protein